MSIKLKKILIVLFSAFAFAFLALGLICTNSTPVKAEINYVNPLPKGAYVEEYTVLDVAKEYGTNGTLTYTTSGDNGKCFELKGAKAYRMNFTQNKSPWSLRLSIFNDNQGFLRPNNSSAYVDLRDGLLDVLPNEKVHNVNWQFPDGVNYKSGTNTYEFGGPRVFNTNGGYIGRLFYLEINGFRVLEYFFNSADSSILNNDYFWIHDVLSGSAGTSTITITSPAVQDLTNKVTAEFSEELVAIDGKAVPKVIVYSQKTHGGVTYTQIIESKYYDVEYVEDGSDVGVATITFKDKYSGSLISQYKAANIEIVDANGAVVTLNQTVFTKDPDGKPITPYVIAVEKNGKAIAQENYTVSYENNVNTGTGKVIVTFKNFYEGKAFALFKINPVLSKYHYVDANPIIMDISDKYADGNSIEITENQANSDVTVGQYFDMAGADVVRFKMTAQKNAWNNYFALFVDKATQTYYKGKAGLCYYSLPKLGRQLELQVRNVTSVVAKYLTDRPTDFDIGADAGVCINVEVGALKIFHSKDDVTTYSGRLFYIEFDGKRASEYILLNPDINFSGGDFFIGGNTTQITIDKFDLGNNTPVANGMGVNLGGLNIGNNTMNNTANVNNAQPSNFVLLLVALGCLTVIVAFVATVIVVRKRKN